MSIITDTCYDKIADKIWELSPNSNGVCHIIKIDDKYRVLKKIYNRSGIEVGNIYKNVLSFNIPLCPTFIDCSQNHDGEKFDWILMDYIPGNTLTTLIEFGCHEGRIKRVYMLEILAAIVRQLCLMKKRGIKHRDLKTDNIVVDADLIPHIVDWDDSTDRFSLSKVETHGTVPYAAPEALDSHRNCESDVFSFGSIMFHMITKHFPFWKAYTTKAGLESIVKLYSELDLPDIEETLTILGDYEAMSKSDKAINWGTIVSHVEPILISLIKAGARDTSLSMDSDLLKDPFNKMISDLITQCWKANIEERILPKQLQSEIDKIAKEVLTDPNELEHYNRKCEMIYQLEPKEYGIQKNIEKATEIGLFENDPVLLRIIKDTDALFKYPSTSLFEIYVRSLSK